MLSAELLCSLLLSAPDAIVIIDASGTIQYANLQVAALFGYSSSDLVGKSVDQLLPERFRPRHAAHRDTYANASRLRPMGSGLELFARREDGSEFPVEISLSPIRDGEHQLVAAAIRDASGRKRAEAALRQARAEADQANFTKSRFLATASHDLRQPLQSLALLNGSLRRLMADDDAREALDQQSLAIDSMTRLLNSLLDISKLESGAVEPLLATFRVHTLFTHLRAEFTQIARSKALQLTFDAGDCYARSDAALVGQILRNLISNAIKYTQQGSVQVTARLKHDMVCLEVVDTGIGIARDQIDRIYDEFYQIGVNPNAARDGYGLGLGIVQRLARLLNAMLGVDSRPGVGSTFSLMLPQGTVAAGGEVAPTLRSPIAPAGAEGHVLLVEDDPGVRNATRIFLTLEGFKVTAVESLEAATAAARFPARIDVVVTDYHLPGNSTGTDVIAAIRKLQERSVRAVLVTGDTSAAIRDMHTDQGLRIVSKPVNADELAAILRCLLAP
jgi:PAS domain S-box-containing protein